MLNHTSSIIGLLITFSLLSTRAATVEPQQQPLSSSLPVVEGWSSLQTTSHLAYSWSHELQLWNSSSSSKLIIPRYGRSTTQLSAHISRTVSQALFAFSGVLQITNPDPSASIWINNLQVQCHWGLSLNLPCSGRLSPGPASVSSTSSSATNRLHAAAAQVGLQQKQKAMAIGPGQTAQCHIQNLPVAAEWGTNFKQSCRVVVTTWNGGATQSGHFMLDFASPDVMSLSNDCIRLSASCKVAGSPHFHSVSTVDKLQKGQLFCDNKTLDLQATVLDTCNGEGDIPDGCGSDIKLTCSSEAATLTTAIEPQAQPPQPAMSSHPPGSSIRFIQDSFSVPVIPEDCIRPLSPSPVPLDPPDSESEPEPPSDSEESAAPLPGRLGSRKPRVSLRIDRTYTVGNFTWLVSSSVAPEQLQIYADSTAAAQYSVTALRVPLLPSEPIKYYVEGTITLENSHWQPIQVASISAVLPWGQAATCQPDDLLLPGTLDAGIKLTCSFRVNYELALKPSSLRAYVNFVGDAKPLKSKPRPFDFSKADWSFSQGACARVVMEFTADSPDVSVSHVGGNAPPFGGAGTDVCGEFAKWDFTVLVTPLDKKPGEIIQVVSNTTVTPTSLTGDSRSSRQAGTVLKADVKDWPWGRAGPLLKATGSWRRGGEVPILVPRNTDQMLLLAGERNESVTIRVNI